MMKVGSSGATLLVHDAIVISLVALNFTRYAALSLSTAWGMYKSFDMELFRLTWLRRMRPSKRPESVIIGRVMIVHARRISRYAPVMRLGGRPSLNILLATDSLLFVVMICRNINSTYTFVGSLCAEQKMNGLINSNLERNSGCISM